MGAGYNSADGHMVELFFWRCRFLLFVNGKQHASISNVASCYSVVYFNCILWKHLLSNT